MVVQFKFTGFGQGAFTVAPIIIIKKIQGIQARR